MSGPDLDPNCLTLRWYFEKVNFEQNLQTTASVFGDLNQYQIVVPLFGAAYATPNKGTTI